MFAQQRRFAAAPARFAAASVTLFSGNDMPPPIAFEQQQKLTLRGIQEARESSDNADEGVGHPAHSAVIDHLKTRSWNFRPRAQLSNRAKLSFHF